MDILKYIKTKSIFYKSVAVLICAVMILSVFTVSIVASADNPIIWDGTKASSYAGGEGTEEKPYLIENGAQLYKMVAENTNVAYSNLASATPKYFKITKDIYLNDVNSEDLVSPTNTVWNSKYNCWYYHDAQKNGFYGVVDGGGHTIYGLYLDGTKSYAGLIPNVVGDGKFQNINIKNSYVYGKCAGGIVGSAYGANTTLEVSKCTVENSYIQGWTSSVRVGGIVGGGESTKKITIADCSVTNTNLKTRNYSKYLGIESGILGYIGAKGSGHTVTNCFTDEKIHPVCAATATDVCGDSSGGPVFDRISNNVTYTNVYTSADCPVAAAGVTKLTSANMKGENAKSNLQGFDFNNVWEVKENAYPVLKAPIAVWDGSKVSSLDALEGKGTATEPYLIKNGAQLAYVVSTDLTDGLHFKLANDIHLNDTSKANWKDTARNWVWADVRFTGTFDGNGHTIDGLYYNGAQKRMGLFSYVGADNSGTHQAIVKNFTMTNAYINNTVTSDANGTAFVAGQASRVAYFESIYIDETCEITTSTVTGVGGILGQSGYNVFMTNCAVHGTLSGKANIGAFVGTVSSGAKLTLNNSISSANAYVQGVTDRNLGSASAAIYATKKQGTVDSAVTQLTADQMKGEAAKANMTGLSFRFVWETVENSYPKLNLRGELWSGTWVTDFSSFEGKGTEKEPYEIENGAQLAFALVKNSKLNGGYHYKLVEDIILNDTQIDNWKNSATQWLHQTANRFVGVLDGDGHTIEGLYMNTSTKRPGLVSYSQGTFKNIKFISASINYTGASEPGVAIVAAQTSGPTNFDKIYIDETSEINSTAVKGVAALAGRGYDSTGKVNITNCAVLATINTAGTECGALAGSHWISDATVTIQNCFSISGVPLFGGTIALTNSNNNYSVVADKRGTTVLTADQMKGEDAKINMSGLDFRTIFETVEGKYPIINVREAPSIPIGDGWDGTKAASLTEFKGEGTKDVPYEIENAKQLAYVVSTDLEDGLYFKLVADIKINDTTKENWKDSARNWVWANVRFVGNFDGDGHTIEGLYFNGDQGRFGLFSFVGANDAGTISTLIKNFKLTNAYIYNTATSYNVSGADSKQGVSFIAGQTSAATDFDTIYIDETCYLEAPNAKGVGGIVGRGNKNVNITNSAVLATIIGPQHVGAFFGTHWGGTQTVNNSFSASNVPIMSSRTLSNSANNYATVLNGTYDKDVTLLTADQMKGEAAKINMPNLDYVTAFETVDGKYPIINVREKPPVPPRPDYVWDGTKADTFAGGTGAPTDPYLIENGAQLYKMICDYTVSSNDGEIKAVTYFKIVKDIYLNDVKDADMSNPTTMAWDNAGHISWDTDIYDSRTIGFCGDVDGGGHTVYGLYYKQGNYAGLIPIAADTTNVYNLTLKDSFVRASGNPTGAGPGGIIGLVSGAEINRSTANISYCKVDNCYIFADHTDSWRIGAIIGGGYNEGKVIISNCAVTNIKMKIANPQTVGRTSAFIGSTTYSNHEVTNCFTDSSIHPVTNAVTKENYDILHERKTFTNVYTSSAKPEFDVYGDITYLTEAQMKGEEAKINFEGFDFENDWAVVENDYPAFRKNAGVWMYDNTLPGEVWSGKIARYYNSGDGTKENPYEIKTGGQLALLINDALNGKTAGKHYKITEDIILNDTSKENWKDTAKEWYIGSWEQAFRGHLDGGYHTISGLYLNKTKETYNGPKYYGGLFAAISTNAVIEKLGIVNSSMTFTNTTNKDGTFVGTFAGFMSYERFKNATYDDYPLIRECFADTTVYLDANTCGGFIGNAQVPIRVEDSFFTGTVKGTGRGLFGYSKMSGYDDVLIKNFYAADSKYAIISNVSYDTFKYQNCYSSSAQDTEGVTRLFIDRMIGKAAQKYMNNFDFENVWAIRGDKETPGLKGFDPDSFTNVMNPEDIVVNFESNCDLLVDSITGKAYSKLTLPVLKREGYIFEGWYAYPELDVPFTYDYFPTFNTILYAKWTLRGFAQDFEQYEDSIYDYHDDYEYYRPTVANYSAKYVRGGGKSMHRIGASAEELDFLLFYNEELEIGKKYKMVFYTTTDQDKASVKLSLVHLDWPDVYSNNNGVESLGTISNLKDGKWQEVTFTFVARSKWIAIRTSGNNSVYFDDFTLFDVGNGVIKPLNSTDDKAEDKSEVDNAITEEPEIDVPQEDNTPDNSKPQNPVTNTTDEDQGLATIWYIVIAVGSLIVLGGIIFVIIKFVIRKK